jgi:hypothetical protein
VQTITHQHHNSRQHTPPTPQNTPPHTNHNHHAPFTPTPHTNGPTHTTYTALLPSRRHTRRRDPHTPPYHHRAVSGALPNSLYCLRTRRARSCMRHIAADFDSALTRAAKCGCSSRASLCTDDSPERLSVRGPAHTHTHTHTHTALLSRPCAVSFFFSVYSRPTLYTANCILHSAYCRVPAALACAPRGLPNRTTE